MSETRSLHRKLAQVMYEAERIPKTGTAPQQMGGYKFVEIGVAADFIRKALAEKVVTMMPSAVRVVGQVDRATAKGGIMTTVDLIVTWTLTDGESGETATIESFGAGADGGDKYSGKASTSAMKYALLSGFLLSTGEDSELGTATAVSRQDGPLYERTEAPAEPRAPGSLIGIAKVGTKQSSDGELRVTPDGHRLGFRLEAREGDKGGILVEVNDPLASELAAFAEAWHDQPVTCFGAIETREFTPKGGHKVTFQALVLERLQTPTLSFPLPEDDGVRDADDDAELDLALDLVP